MPTNHNDIAVKLARSASSAAADSAERAAFVAKLASYCAEHNLVVADIIDAASRPDVAPRVPLTDAQRAARDAAATKRSAPKPKPEPAKAEKPSEPGHAAGSDATDDKHSERRVLLNARRAICDAIHPDAASPGTRSTVKLAKLSDYADRFDSPKQRTRTELVSSRDLSQCANAFFSNASNFDPVALAFDIGIFSRMRSIGYIVAGTKPGHYALSTACVTATKRAIHAAPITVDMLAAAGYVAAAKRAASAA